MQDSCYVFRFPQEIPIDCRMRHLRRQVCLRGLQAIGKYQKLKEKTLNPLIRSNGKKWGKWPHSVKH